MSTESTTRRFFSALKRRLSIPSKQRDFPPAKEISPVSESDASVSPVHSVVGRDDLLRENSQPTYGKRIVISVVDETAAAEPNRHWLSIPNSLDPKDGWRKVTFGELGNAVNRTAQQILDTCGPAEKDTFPTIAYIAPNDFRYMIFTLAATKAGYKALFISPRNNKASQLSLFEATDCHWFCYATEFEKTAQILLAERSMQSFIALTIPETLNPETVPVIPYTKSYEEARYDPCVVLHTSGSTGTPKPIFLKQELVCQIDRYHNIAEWNGHEFIFKAMANISDLDLMTMPLFHAAGTFLVFSVTMLWKKPTALYGSNPLNSEGILEAMKYCGADSMTAPPSAVADLSKTDEGMALLKKMRFVVWGGGSIAKETGDKLANEGVNICTIISTTECSMFPIYWSRANKKDWEYFCFNNDLFGCEYREVSDGVYEQVIVKQKEDRGFQGIFVTFPELTEYHTKDLYRPHPTLPNYWRHAGRLDDVIVFSNGEKLNPVSIEGMVSDHPEVKQAIVVGQTRFQAGMFIEPYKHPQTEADEKALIDRVWPLIEQANAQTVHHGRITRHLIRLTDPSKPVPRAGKGTLQRQAMTKLYEEEMNKLYEGTGSEEAPSINLASTETLMLDIISILQSLSSEALDLKPDSDFSLAGVDSLQIITASRLLTLGLAAAEGRKNDLVVAPKDFYENPSATQLAGKIYARAVVTDENGVSKSDSELQAEAVDALVAKYTVDLPEPNMHQLTPSDNDQTVLLTGSTGRLGAYLLDYLESNPRVSKIFCLNRSEDGGVARQPNISAGNGLSTSFSKTEFVHADIAKPNLGLESQELYDRIAGSVDRIVHNAWPVNFNMSVASFEPSICGTRRLVDLAHIAKKNCSIVFISSIATVEGWTDTSKPVPEQPLDDPNLAIMGYGQSKQISSRILDAAVTKSGIRAVTARVGQIGGSRAATGGPWNRQEWFPTIIASSLHMGLLPQNMGAMDGIDWMPVEDVALTVLDLAGVQELKAPESLVGYYHIVNPCAVQWSGELASRVQSFYAEQGRSMKMVSFAEWIEAVAKEASLGSGDAAAKNPAIKLLDTWHGFAGQHKTTFGTERTQEASSTMRASKAVTADLMELWCKQWAF